MTMSRRAFMLDLGKGTLAVAVFGLGAMACSDDDPISPTSTPSTSPESTTPPTTTPVTTSPQTTNPVTTKPLAVEAVQWERVNLGFVSAYVLARAGEAAVVDTGVSGSERDIQASLAAIGMTWADVGHVIVTHLHPDHQGSLPAVMNAAAGATAYAGAGDIPEISSPRPITPVGDGDMVFDLEIIDTPGHTPGHISVLDGLGGLLIAGDALNGTDGGVIGANPDFTADIPLADDSVRKLATFTFDTVVFGHGDPVVGNASQQVAELAASI